MISRIRRTAVTGRRRNSWVIAVLGLIVALPLPAQQSTPPLPPATKPAAPPAPPRIPPAKAGESDDDFIEFLGSDDTGDADWWEFLKKRGVARPKPPAPPSQDAKQ
jgi:hypothetical protein